MKPFIVLLAMFCILHGLALPSGAGGPDISADEHVRRAEGFFHNSQLFSAVDEYKKAVSLGFESADVFRKLGLLYYELGFPDEAASQLEKAVRMNPDPVFPKIELGLIYFSGGQLDNAAEQFMAALAKNPALSSAYYYLGQIFFRKKQYDLAWLSFKTAGCLGHSELDMIRQIELLSPPPQITPCAYDGEDLYIRQIAVKTNLQAEEVMRRLSDGELFEDIAGEYNNSSADTRGYIGRFSPSDIHQRIAEALIPQKVFSSPLAVQTGSEVLILQRIAPFNFDDWKQRLINNTRPSIVNHAEKAVPPEDARKDIKEMYIVYAGSYRYMKAAEAIVARLTGLGYASYQYEETTETKGTLYIVIAGKYESFSMAKEAGEGLTQQGIEYFISPQKIMP